MKILLSPAKSLDYKSELPTLKTSEGCFLNEAQYLNKILKEKSPKDLSDLMGISSSLGELNFQRNNSWSLPFSPKNARQSIYAFSGDVYRGLDSYTIGEDKIDFMQKSVRIISGLYGLLKPLDLIQPYRLEMGTKMRVDDNKNLYEYWRQKITSQLNKELADDEPVLNLASNEYFKAIDSKVVKTGIYTANFKQLKNGEYKTIAIFSKKARGLMTRFIIDNNITDVNDLKSFNYDNYIFHESLSSEKEFIFTR
ncbi:MAG: peroxide stress protein YaaA [Flavobacteriaceae bacterium]|nr:peroxide stress protein YaaA [Flavobacteriaceae bacterium]